MESALHKQMKELCQAADQVTHLLGWATVEDVAELRMQLNRVQDAIAGKTNEQVLNEMQNIYSLEEQAVDYLSIDMRPDVKVYDPSVLVVEVNDTLHDPEDEGYEPITNITRAGMAQKGPRFNLEAVGTINANHTAAAAPDLSKCFAMVIKS